MNGAILTLLNYTSSEWQCFAITPNIIIGF